MKRALELISTGFIALLFQACSDNKQYETAMCALVDISGTYASEKTSVANIIKAGVLSSLLPGDSLFLITIDSNSYNDKDLKAKLTLDYRPSEANKQKLAFSNKLDEFANDPARSQYTDVSGAMMLCGDYLKKTQAGTQIMLIFSDMREELPPGVKRKFDEDEFKNIDILALNVIKLNKDSNDPTIFRERLKTWEQTALNSGAHRWDIIDDAISIPGHIHSLRN